MIVLLYNVSLNEKEKKKWKQLSNNQPISAVYMAIRWNFKSVTFL